MSFYFGVIMPDLVAIATDRTRVEYPGPVITSDGPRYFQPFQNQNFVIVPAGFLHVSLKVAEIMYALGNDNGIFKIENLMFPFKKKEFQIRTRSYFEEMKLKYGDTNSNFNFDTLFAGRGFLGCVSAQTNFELQVLKEPGYIILNQPPELLSHVIERVKLFMGAVSGLPTETKKKFALKVFPQVMYWMHEKAHRVSPSGDIIFIDSEGVKTFDYWKGEADLPIPTKGEGMG